MTRLTESLCHAQHPEMDVCPLTSQPPARRGHHSYVRDGQLILSEFKLYVKSQTAW